MIRFLQFFSLLLLATGCSKIPPGESSVLAGPASANSVKSLAEAALLECDDAGIVVEMSLSGMRAKSVDLAELEAFPKLKSLTLQECSWIQAGDLKHLEHLSEIEEVVLIRTPVSEEGLAEFANLPSLRKIHLIHTKVTGAGLRLLTGNNLEQLTLHGDAITSADLDSLREFSHLRELTINCASVDLSKLSGLSTLIFLEQLNVRGCQGLEQGFVEQLQSLESLRSFEFDANRVSLGTIEQLASLARLEELDLTASDISNPELEKLLALEKLSTLKLNGCTNITDASLLIIAQFENLNRLYLSHSSVHGTGLAYLSKLPRLREVAIFSGQLDRPGRQALKEFQQMRPDCVVAVESQ